MMDNKNFLSVLQDVRTLTCSHHVDAGPWAIFPASFAAHFNDWLMSINES